MLKISSPLLLAGLKQLLNYRCLLCELPSCDCLCDPCKFNLPQIESCCKCCANILPSSASKSLLCGDCLRRPKPFRQTVAALIYEPPLLQLIARYKQGQPHPLGALFADLMTQKILEFYRQQPLPDLIVTVPSTWRSLLNRGYNPAHDLAERLSNALNIPCENIVKRVGSAAAQKQLSRSQRLKNLNNAFHCTTHLKGKNIAIVDDIVTTCATAISVTHCLQSNDCGWVDVWCLARTP